jgi:hypothetical protein
MCLRAASCRNARNRPLSLPELCLFSVWLRVSVVGADPGEARTMLSHDHQTHADHWGADSIFWSAQVKQQARILFALNDSQIFKNRNQTRIFDQKTPY